MKQTHINCQERRCEDCFSDAMRLEAILKKKTGDESKYDLLGHYHSWLAKNGIPNETEFGWPSSQTYLDENIDSFCKWFRNTKQIS